MLERKIKYVEKILPRRLVLLLLLLLLLLLIVLNRTLPPSL